MTTKSLSENSSLEFRVRVDDLPHMKRPHPQETDATFGRRLARLRKEAGYSQRDLAPELGISQRMLAYYEAQTEHPPAHLLTKIADALGLTTDQLLGRQRIPARSSPKNERLLRRLRTVEKLPARARQAVLDHIDALVAKHGAAS